MESRFPFWKMHFNPFAKTYFLPFRNLYFKGNFQVSVRHNKVMFSSCFGTLLSLLSEFLLLRLVFCSARAVPVCPCPHTPLSSLFGAPWLILVLGSLSERCLKFWSYSPSVIPGSHLLPSWLPETSCMFSSCCWRTFVLWPHNGSSRRWQNIGDGE